MSLSFFARIDSGVRVKTVVRVFRVTGYKMGTVIAGCALCFFTKRDVLLLLMFAVTNSKFEPSERSKSVLSGTPILSTFMPVLFHLSETVW